MEELTFTFLDEYSCGVGNVKVISDVNGEVITDNDGIASFPTGDQIFTIGTDTTPNVPVVEVRTNFLFTKFTNYTPRP